MIALKNGWSCIDHGSRGVRESTFYSNGLTTYVMYRIQYGIANGMIYMGAWDSGDLLQKADFTVTYPDGTGGTNTESYPNETQLSISAADTQTTTSTNGGRLLALANEFKDEFFGGVTQTTASLFDWLQRNYGQHNYYCVGSSDNVRLTKDPYNRAGTTQSAEYGIDCAQADGETFDPESEHVTFTGTNYGQVVTVYPSHGNHRDFIIASLVFGNFQQNTLKFDVYVDGAKDPNVSVRWENDVDDDTFSLQLVSPHVWTLPDSQPSYPYVSVDGILVPNEANPRMRKYSYVWAGQYDKPYLTEFATCTEGMSALDKVAVYGADGIAERMRYLLRFNKQKNENNTGVMTWGDCFIVDVPREVSSVSDISVTQLDPSTNNPEFVTTIEIILGAPPDDIPDDGDDYPDGQDFDGNPDGVYEDDDIHDFDTGKPTGFSGKALLTKTYAMTALRTQNLGTKLWTQSYFDVLKIQNNPIENVVSMKWFPFSVSGTDTEIKIGNVLMGTNGEVVDSIYKFTVGSAYYRSKKSKATFLDCSPYTQIKLHLPYCGIIQLDASEMLNRKITVSYVVDLVSGDCMAFIELDGTELGEKRIPFMSVSGHIGVDIPLTASNRIQAEMRAASTAISAVSGAAAHVIGGDVVGGAVQAAQGALSVAGMDYTTQRTAAHSPACMTHENRTVFLEIWRPAFDEEIATNNGFKSRHGFPTYKYKTISELSGFVKCDARTKINFAMTGRENQMLEELLTSGVYV